MSRRSITAVFAALVLAGAVACEKSSKSSSEEAPITRGSTPKPLPPPPVKPPEPPPVVDDHAGDPHADHDHHDGEAAPPVGGSVPMAPAAALPMDTVRAPVAADLPIYLKNVRGTGTLRAEIATSMGTFHCVLLEKEAPMTVANFIGLATGAKPWTDPRSQKVMTKTPFFNGLIFHRVIPEFMIQGGDPLGQGIGGPGYDFADEVASGLAMDAPGLLAMANSGPGTNGSQFFITEAAAPWLTARHTIFGRCAEVDLVKKITGVPRDDGDRPRTPVTIKKVTILRK